jgi:hypothetical protein
LVSVLSLDESQIARAAEDMIGEYGDGAVTKVDAWVKALKSEGFFSVAKTWELVREVIKDLQQSDARMRGHENTFTNGVIQPERSFNPQSRKQGDEA